MSERLFNIELAYQNLRQNLKIISSCHFKILHISKFLSLTLNEGNEEKYYSYYLEVRPKLFELIFLNDFDFISPDEINELTSQLKRLKEFPIFSDKQKEFDEAILYLENVTSDIMKVLKSDDETTKYETHSIPIVFVEGNNSSNDIKSAVVYKLHISSSIRSKGEHTDNVEFKNMIDTSDTKIIEQLNKIVKSAKSEINNTTFYNFTFWFNEKENIYTGTSLGIGAICLCYNAILINELSKFYYKFNSKTVFTGEVDQYGNLTKMNNDILKIKLNAIFFSGYKLVVIPEDNLSDAKGFIDELMHKYPERKMEIIPLKKFTSVFKNPEVAEKCELKPIQKAKALLNRHQKEVNYSISILSLLIILFFGYKIVLPMLDDNPVFKLYDNDRLAAVNKYDKIIWESSFRLNIEKENKNIKDEALDKTIMISDFDEDGKNEIVVINPSNEDQYVRRKIFCYNSDGSSKWEFSSPHHEVNYSGNKYDDNFMYYLIHNSDYKLDRKKYFVSCGGIYQYFPCQIAIHDNDGKEISTYWNSGSIIQVKVYDINSDGKEEIYACGVNNKSRSAELLVFDPEIMRGSSFLTDPMNSGVKGTEKYCILFPQTIFTKVFGEGYNWAYSVGLKDNNQITVGVMDLIDGGLMSNYNPVIKYDFDEKMNIVHTGLSSTFAARYEEYKNDSTKHFPQAINWQNYTDSLRKEIRYWDGEKFVNNPVMNKYYLIARDSLNAIR